MVDFQLSRGIYVLLHFKAGVIIKPIIKKKIFLSCFNPRPLLWKANEKYGMHPGRSRGPESSFVLKRLSRYHLFKGFFHAESPSHAHHETKTDCREFQSHVPEHHPWSTFNKPQLGKSTEFSSHSQKALKLLLNILPFLLLTGETTF